MPNNKSKGSKAERELLRLFTENSWRAVRVAGSGVNDDSPCDLIVGKLGKRGHTIESKSSKRSSIYITKSQIEDFVLFSSIMGLTPVIAVRFSREGWYFISPQQLKDTGNFFAINIKTAKEEGKRFSQFFEESYG